MSKSGGNLQDSFLNQVRKENGEVKILLVNGTVLRGYVKGFDNFTVVLNERNGQQHLVYKHAVAHVMIRGHAERGGSNERGGEAPQAAGNTEEAPKGRTSHEEQVPQARAPRDKDADKQAQKPKKETFNGIDLSALKIGTDSKND